MLFYLKYRQINVSLIDGSTLSLDLVSGSNTTVDQLLAQIAVVTPSSALLQLFYSIVLLKFKKLDMHDDSLNMFAIWICSKNLS